MKSIVAFLILLGSIPAFAQFDSSKVSEEWPYSMPIWGKKAVERGYKIQLPYGLNVNYVYNRMDLEITSFGMSIGDDPNSSVNQLISEYLTKENLNFTNTIARTNGMNIRADVWILPFLNVYGIFSNSTGTTEVSLQPTWFDDEGNLVLSLSEISSIVDFSANTFGVGSTIAGKLSGSYFFSVDGNISWSYSELLDDAATLTVLSARIGDRIELKNGSQISLYVGGMYRGFIGNQGNFGAIQIDQALPELGGELFPAIDQKISTNNEKIAALNPNNPIDQAQIQVLERKNQILREIESTTEQVLTSEVNYGIKKDIINNWSVQFGFNYEINQNLTIRGEFGKGWGNDFVLTGIQYRFGI